MTDDQHPAKPVLVFDGDCGYCRRWIERWRALTRDRIDYTAYQDLGERLRHIPRDDFAQAVHLIEPDGRVSTGAAAVFRTLALGGAKRWAWWLYQHVPGVAPVTEAVYRGVARNRRTLSGVTRLLWGRHVTPPTFHLSRWLILRAMGVVYLIAFVSLAVQVTALAGERGILPAADYLQRYEQHVEGNRFLSLPTLAWIDCSDEALRGMCIGGAVTSVLVIFRILPAPALLLLWVLYLSLVGVCRVFLHYQWDILLLEVGLLSVVLAPWSLRPRLRSERAPSRIAMWLFRWLLFRLLFCSGVVKLLADDPQNPTWHQLTALHFHYESQPLTTWIGWYAHQLPGWFHKTSVAIMFIVEILVPFLIFLPRRPRILAFLATAVFMLLIALTGNYNFFNLLTVVLGISLLDDHTLQRFLPRRMRTALESNRPRRRVRAPQAIVTMLLAAGVLVVSGVWMVETFVGFRKLSPAGQAVLRTAMPFRSVNNYGLFRRMTTGRREIVVEGSHDGRAWQAYEFKWKPGDPARRPGFVAPHQPRLDWQMWFAALTSSKRTRHQWFPRFLTRLLEGSPEVLALMGTNPFPDAPPKFIRAVLYDYHLTDAETRRETGAWWTREVLGIYAPARKLRVAPR